MRFDVITIFPELFQPFMQHGVSGRALQRGIAHLYAWNLRDYATDARRTIDDRPYGGGPGMLMQVEPLQKAIHAARTAAPSSTVIFLSPQGNLLNQEIIRSFIQRTGMILIAGRYEGVDERVLKCYVDEEWSIGDYVLSGGELPILILIDAVIRLLPGALGHVDSANQDSHSNGLLDHPHYTRPERIEMECVPDVLLNGNHQLIRHWRLQQALGRTCIRRPDLLEKRGLSDIERQLLHAFIDSLPQRID